MLVDFISCNSSWVTPKHVKVWSLSKKVVFHFFAPYWLLVLFLTHVYNVFLDDLGWVSAWYCAFREVWSGLPLVPLRFITALYRGNHLRPPAH